MISYFCKYIEKQNKKKVKSMLGIERADIIASADYREDTEIDLFVKSVIDKVITDSHLKYLQRELND